MDDSQHRNIFPPLTSEQIRELATAVRDDFGPSLSRAIFIDHLLMLLEDVPGFEAGGITTSLIESAWVGYAGLTD
ncbi:hypothetical protein ACFSHT_07170 [Paraburkholderia silviterrae]|uniref:Uncharacterized protein n=1 Tax=Paraburkholderia silviterrae TaxID=2528715 RepID=A0A4R5MCH4_9BURK|nr:hypothetical protein [Paraburkholderia silviterrae]TDG24670.1 hypothetical protein EYW47_08965 [Paraburkholderia silviterrae]